MLFSTAKKQDKTGNHQSYKSTLLALNTLPGNPDDLLFLGPGIPFQLSLSLPELCPWPPPFD